VNKHVPDHASIKTVKLKKALYGLVNSPRLWFQSLTASLQEIGFNQTHSDPCLWTKSKDNEVVGAIAFFVDDCAVTAPASEINELKSALQRRYRMTDQGPITWFVGVRVHYDITRGFLSLSQASAVTKLLELHQMADCKIVSTPCTGTLVKTDTVDNSMKGKPYSALVGSLLWLLYTRPDIAFAVNQLTRHVQNPSNEHWTAAVRVLKYLRGTANFGLEYSRAGGTLVGYSDADFASDVNTRRSTSGFVYLLNGAAISWKSKLQPSVSLSTCEAELYALALAAQEGIWLRRLVSELDMPCRDQTVVLHEDNQGTIALLQNARFSHRTKHVDVKYFFIRDHLANRSFAITYCPTEHMVADIFTKPLERVIFQRLRSKLGLKDLTGAFKG